MSSTPASFDPFSVSLQLPLAPESGLSFVLADLVGLVVVAVVLAAFGYGFLLLWRRIADSVRVDRRERE